ncbi:unnamed protein product, partial [Symbiodinium necroappetens]
MGTSLYHLAAAVLRRADPEGVNAAVLSLLEHLQNDDETQQFDGFLKKKNAAESARLADSVSQRTLRGLCVIDAALSHSSVQAGSEDVAPLLGGSELVHTWLRPALTRADAAEPLLGASWSRHRMLAIRCMALLTSVEPEVASTHWPFFLSLLRRFGSRSGREAELISQTCAMFLSDVLLLHSGASEWFPDPAAKSAALLAALRKAQAVSPPLRRKLSEKIAMMMLYGADREITIESTWALTSMMLEVFHHPAGKPSAEVADSAKLDLEEAEEAAHRGRLLCFF